MSGSILLTLEDILRDQEVYDFLASRFGDRLPLPPVSETDNIIDRPLSAPVSKDEPVEETIEELPQSSTQCDTALTAPSPTYSFPSLSDDDTVISVGEDVDNSPISTLPEEQNTTPPEETKTLVDPKSLKLFRAVVSSSSSIDSEHRHKLKVPKWNSLPPLFIQAREKKWIEVTCWCFERKIKFKYIGRTPHGMKTIVQTFADYDGLIKLLLEKKIPFCKSTGRPLRAVIHGIPSDLTCESIKQDLVNQNVSVREVYRLGRGSNGVDVYDIVIAIVEWSARGKLIFKINSLCDITNISVEAWNHKNRKKCVRCRLYGHFDRFCRVPLCCVNCDEDHVTPDCKLPQARVYGPCSEYGNPVKNQKCKPGVRCCYKPLLDHYAALQSVTKGLQRVSLSAGQKAFSSSSNPTGENSYLAAEQSKPSVIPFNPTTVESVPIAKQSEHTAKQLKPTGEQPQPIAEQSKFAANESKPTVKELKLATEPSKPTVLQFKSTAESSKSKDEQLIHTEEPSQFTVKQLKPVTEQSKPTTESKAVQTSSPEPDYDQSLKADLALVTRFANEFFFNKDEKSVLEINKLIRENEGNPLALVHIGMQHASLLEKLSNFRIDS